MYQPSWTIFRMSSESFLPLAQVFHCNVSAGFIHDERPQLTLFWPRPYILAANRSNFFSSPWSFWLTGRGSPVERHKTEWFERPFGNRTVPGGPEVHKSHRSVAMTCQLSKECDRLECTAPRLRARLVACDSWGHLADRRFASDRKCPAHFYMPEFKLYTAQNAWGNVEIWSLGPTNRRGFTFKSKSSSRQPTKARYAK